ncbi:RsmD family RNA methyltransferase, partial [Candidatus Bipolaricaulota bacterium]|nr:RsmD family RNA methyltransferase [Candidatus Bipolaricaulota bacterium]
TEEALDKFDRRDRRFDLIFIGPPYDQGLEGNTLNQLGRNKVAKNRGLVAVEVFFKNDLARSYGNLAKIKESEYGQNKLVFYRRGGIEER